ncbi:4'-phosphopantetheinyl transferase family protein [Methanobrevibacter sp.]|uniref:4'-phosphopantetheinyl transferase family protein n=1 Tax=Methanobrevibacter sp. TaxID=66852 RepID=UPI003866E7E4
MIKLAYVDVENLDLDASYGLLCESRKHKVDRFMFDRDKRLSAGAYLLLMKLLFEENITEPHFKFGKYGKAYISNHEDIYFNLSHSNKFVACAISDREVGVDIELIDSAIDLNIAKHYFFAGEYESIMNSTDPADEFFNYWVLKESYMKYTGLGFNLKLEDFEIVIGDEIYLKDDENNLKFTLFDLGEYKLAVSGHYYADDVKQYFIEDLF